MKKIMARGESKTSNQVEKQSTKQKETKQSKTALIYKKGDNKGDKKGFFSRLFSAKTTKQSKNKNQDKSQDDKSRKDSNKTSSKSDPKLNTAAANQAKQQSFSRSLLRFALYLVAILVLAALAFAFFEGYNRFSALLAQQVQLIQKSEELDNQIAQLEQQQQAYIEALTRLQAEVDNTRLEVLANQLRTDELSQDLDTNTENIEFLREEIETTDIWMTRLERLLYLAEQERNLGNRPSAIYYLLEEAQEVLFQAPTNPWTSRMDQLLTQDLDQYSPLADIQTRDIYDNLLELRELVADDLEFNDDFYLPNEEETATDTSTSTETSPAPPAIAATRLEAARNAIVGFWGNFYNEVSSYIRIREVSDQDARRLIASRENRENSKRIIDLMINRAQNSLLLGEEEIYYSVLTEIEELITDIFVDDDPRQQSIELLNQLQTTDIIPQALPLIQAYNFFYTG